MTGKVEDVCHVVYNAANTRKGCTSEISRPLSTRVLEARAFANANSVQEVVNRTRGADADRCSHRTVLAVIDLVERYLCGLFMLIRVFCRRTPD
jgi:hypothetical protein